MWIKSTIAECRLIIMHRLRRSHGWVSTRWKPFLDIPKAGPALASLFRAGLLERRHKRGTLREWEYRKIHK